MKSTYVRKRNKFRKTNVLKDLIKGSKVRRDRSSRISIRRRSIIIRYNRLLTKRCRIRVAQDRGQTQMKKMERASHRRMPYQLAAMALPNSNIQQKWSPSSTAAIPTKARRKRRRHHQENQHQILASSKNQHKVHNHSQMQGIITKALRRYWQIVLTNYKCKILQ